MTTVGVERALVKGSPFNAMRSFTVYDRGDPACCALDYDYSCCGGAFLDVARMVL